MRSLVGRVEEVLFEERRRGAWAGHSTGYVKVIVRSRRNLRNVLARVRLDAVLDGEMAGTLA